VANPRAGRAGHRAIGRLVQPTPPTYLHRQPAAGGVRGGLLCRARRVSRRVKTKRGSLHQTQGDSTETAFEGFEFISRTQPPVSSQFQPPNPPGLLHELLHGASTEVTVIYRQMAGGYLPPQLKLHSCDHAHSSTPVASGHASPSKASRTRLAISAASRVKIS
jgi:hypothetical protein